MVLVFLRFPAAEITLILTLKKKKKLYIELYWYSV